MLRSKQPSQTDPAGLRWRNPAIPSSPGMKGLTTPAEKNSGLFASKNHGPKKTHWQMYSLCPFGVTASSGGGGPRSLTQIPDPHASGSHMFTANLRPLQFSPPQRTPHLLLNTIRHPGCTQPSNPPALVQCQNQTKPNTNLKTNTHKTNKFTKSQGSKLFFPSVLCDHDDLFINKLKYTSFSCYYKISYYSQIYNGRFG